MAAASKPLQPGVSSVVQSGSVVLEVPGATPAAKYNVSVERPTNRKKEHVNLVVELNHVLGNDCLSSFLRYNPNDIPPSLDFGFRYLHQGLPYSDLSSDISTIHTIPLRDKDDLPERLREDNLKVLGSPRDMLVDAFYRASRKVLLSVG